VTGHIHQILKQYWGYSSFRALQEDIIHSVLSDRDTLALLPTGGGKSVCFQVPVMAREGLGIVVSPLIALMDDQVQNLRKIGIPAIALNSNLSYREIDLALENAINGSYKFLYISPERLQSELVVERIRRMKVNLLAVDEAHCISQWGYDFRPPYLEIAEVRKLIPNTPILALTATATPRVVDDIQEKLHFSESNVFQKSFYRPNLHYNVLKTESKWSRTLHILKRIPGTAIVYARNRKHTVEIARWLSQNGFSADYYHAGLDSTSRQQKQKEWLENKTRIMVCTNAFGMGIDKPDVRLVIHLELPDSLEAYFQEAGRAGRDGETAYSVVVCGPADVEDLKKRSLDNFPDLENIRKVYRALCNYLQLAVGAGENQTFGFDINAFSKEYGLPILKTYQALKIMEKEGLFTLSEGFKQASRLLLKADRTTLYDFQLRNPSLDPLIKTLVRSYGGLDIEYTSISESLLASRLSTAPEKVTSALLHLKKQGIVDYLPQNDESSITFIKDRQAVEYLSISNENLKDRFLDLKRRVEAVIQFIESEDRCRSKLLLGYFGEENADNCGHCDVCRRQARDTSGNGDSWRIQQAILQYLNARGNASLNELTEIPGFTRDELKQAIRWMLDEEMLTEKDGMVEPYSF
tara:strand:- start:2992 stop:4902 length:1911 start_codon:yes stop_codon:yes gene_type:complete